MGVSGRTSILCGACPLPLPPALSFPPFICVMGACLQGGSWPGCEVIPAISAVSNLELATNSGSTQCQPGNV